MCGWATQNRPAHRAAAPPSPTTRTHQQRGKHVRLGVAPRLLALHRLSCAQRRPCRPALRQVAARQVEGGAAGRLGAALGLLRRLHGCLSRGLVHLAGGGCRHEEGQLQRRRAKGAEH